MTEPTSESRSDEPYKGYFRHQDQPGQPASNYGPYRPGPADGFRQESPLSRKLHRSSRDKWVAGVFGGIAETYNLDSNLLRILFVASFFLPGPQLIFYFVMWFFMPHDEDLLY